MCVHDEVMWSDEIIIMIARKRISVAHEMAAAQNENENDSENNAIITPPSLTVSSKQIYILYIHSHGDNLVCLNTHRSIFESPYISL